MSPSQHTSGRLKQRLVMPGEIHKAYKVLLKLQNPQYFKEDRRIPLQVLKRAKGIAFITTVKAGFVWNGTLGSGIVIARKADGTWSGPSSVGVIGMGWGALVGASSTDSVIILNTNLAVKAFTSKGQVKFGGNLSIALGPVGREADAAVNVGNKGFAACYSYSQSRGLFGGLSLQGVVIGTRDRDNERFYGRHIKAKDILSGHVQPPFCPDLQLLYETLSSILNGQNPLDGNANKGRTQTNSYSTNASANNNYAYEPYEEASNVAVPVATLAPGWQEVKSPDGGVYYWNTVTNQTQYDKPTTVQIQ